MEAVSFAVPHLFSGKVAKYLSPGGAFIAFLAVAQAHVCYAAYQFVCRIPVELCPDTREDDSAAVGASAATLFQVRYPAPAHGLVKASAPCAKSL